MLKITPNPLVNKNLTSGTRLGSMLLDHFFMTMIMMVFFIPTIISGISGAFNVSHEQKATNDFSGPLFYIALFGVALYFCKDCINGRSIAKRILKLQVTNNSTGLVASPIKCFIRNIFCALWPVEIIATLFNPSRRIGDFVAGTTVVYYDPAEVAQPLFDFKKLLLPIVVSYGLVLSLSVPFKGMQMGSEKVKYVESSFNASASKSLEQLYADSLGQYLTASVRVYDKIEQQQLKYISIIFTLNADYLSNKEDATTIRNSTMKYLYNVFPENTFTGQAKYYYKTNNSTQLHSFQIGTTAAPLHGR